MTKKDSIVIDYEIFTTVDSYKNDDYYRLAKDKSGSIYKCRYGHDGDQDWYITCYEDIENGDPNFFNKEELIYYKKSGRLPFEYVYEFEWAEVKGLSIDFREIDGRERPCLIRWNENKCYVIE